MNHYKKGTTTKRNHYKKEPLQKRNHYKKEPLHKLFFPEVYIISRGVYVYIISDKFRLLIYMKRFTLHLRDNALRSQPTSPAPL
jgi:hypothetical protein